MGSTFKNYIFRAKTGLLNSSRRESSGATNKLPENLKGLEDLNLRKRMELVKFAYNNSKYYREKYRNIGIDPLQISSENDFLKLPILTRNDLKNHFSDVKADDVPDKFYYKATTGGSTGTPITVLHDKRYPLTSIQWRVLEWWGIKPYDNSAYIYRLRRTGVDKLLNYLMWWPTKRIFLDASEMSGDSISKFISSYKKTQPTLIQGYVGAVYEFALYLKDHNIKINPPKAVWVTSAPLNKMQRLLMEEVFGAPVYDQYGTCEIMWLAAECKEQTGLHIMSDIRHIEFVDENDQPVAPNEWGRILITDLVNYAFPLIRYEIGDKGRALDFKCKCGVEFPLMDSVKGRKSDVIKTPSGLMISGEYLTTIFDDFPDVIREFQVIQEKDFSIKLLYIPNEKHFNSEIISAVVMKLKQKTKNEINILAEKAVKINHFKGKTQFVISHLN